MTFIILDAFRVVRLAFHLRVVFSAFLVRKSESHWRWRFLDGNIMHGSFSPRPDQVFFSRPCLTLDLSSTRILMDALSHTLMQFCCLSPFLWLLHR